MFREILLVSLSLFLGASPDFSGSREVIFAPSGRERLLERRVIEEIDGARSRIAVAMFEFTSLDIARALVQAKRRGVTVRILWDAGESSRRSRVRDLLAAGGISLRRVTPVGPRGKRSKSHPRFHHKFCVVDDRRVLTGSYNWTVTADEWGHENLLILDDSGLARTYANEFDKIWNDRKIAN